MRRQQPDSQNDKDHETPVSSVTKRAKRRSKTVTTPVVRRKSKGEEEIALDSPERKAVWQSPKKDNATSFSGGTSGSAVKIKGFARNWRARSTAASTKAQEVVDLLKCFHGSPSTVHPGSVGEAEEAEILSDGQAQMLQSFVNSLQSFSAGINSPNTSPFRPSTEHALAAVAEAAAAGPAWSLSGAQKKSNVFVDMVAKEMEEIMALHEAGLLDLDSEDVQVPVAAASVEAAVVMQEEEVEQAGPSRQSVIDAEVLALNALMVSGWWDEPSTASKEAKRARLDESVPKFPTLGPKYDQYWRLLVLDVSQNTFEDMKDRKCCQIVARTVLLEKDALRILLIRDGWMNPDIPINVGDILHFIGDFGTDGVGVVDLDNGFLVINPDRLVRVTSIGDAVACLRRSVLSEKLKIYDDAAEMIMGETKVMTDFSDVFAAKQMEALLPSFLERLYGVHKTENDVYRRVRDAMPLLRGWADRFLQPGKPPQTAAFDDKPKTPLKINKVLDIEQSVWSPMWGMTGKIDMVVQAQLDNGASVVMPLELKTGPTPPERMGQTGHRAQVILYTVMLEQVYRCRVDAGLLYYSANSAVLGVKRDRRHLASLLQQRNAIAFHLSHPVMPPMKRDPHFCGSCAQAPVCVLVHAAVERGTAASSGIEDIFNDNTAHLSPSYLQFYTKWDAINRVESSSSDKIRSEIWTMSSDVREALGRCLGRMVIPPNGIAVSKTRSGSDTVTFDRDVSFKSSSSSSSSSSSRSLVPLNALARQVISAGDHVIISTEEGRVGVMTGFVLSISERSLVVDVRGPFALPPLAESSDNDFHALVDIEDIMTRQTVHHDKRQLASRVVWRIDVDALATEVGVHNRSLAWLMKVENARLRSLVVDLREPLFRPSTAASVAQALDNSTQSPLSQPENKGEEELWRRLHASLNVYQLRAVENALNAQDYSLVLGVPGSGKTATMAWMVAVLALRGQSVLVTGFTHASVDALLCKLVELGVSFVRLAPSPNAVHPDVRPFVLAQKAKTVAELQHILETPLVVGATCLQVKHQLFSRRRFDVCIVDEATQITMSAVLGPLRCANRFVLVGDHYQLPPFVKSAEARELGMGQSLFYTLSKEHPRAVSMLEYQYRMNSDIMLLCNSLVYNHKLRCGNEAVARGVLNVANLESVPEGWLREVCQPWRRAVLLDTDEAALGEDEGGRGANRGEAKIVTKIVKTLLGTCGVKSESVGVLTPFRAQVLLIREELGVFNVEVGTVDSSQGRDWDCVILSMARSNDGYMAGELLEDWRRLNVAMSRAKSKLLVIADRATMKSVHVMKDMCDLMEARNWIITLPKNVLK